MIAALLTGIAASPWTRAALRYGAIALTILLFLLDYGAPASAPGVWWSGSRPRIEPMKPKDGCSRRRRVVLLLATIWLSGGEF